MNQSTITCPSCNGHQWPFKTTGLRTCPACRTALVLTKGGNIRSRVSVGTVACPSCKSHTWPSTTAGLRTCPKCRIVAMLDGAATIHRDARAPERFYKVVSVDGTILCAACSLPVSVSVAIDGRAGRARGYICPSCQVSRNAQPVGIKRPKAGSTFAVVRSLSKNTIEQDDMALLGLAILDRVRRRGELVEYGVCLEGANWAHTGDSRWITSAGSTPSHPVDCSCLEHKRTERIAPQFYPSVKYGDTLAHYQGMMAAIRAPFVRYRFNPPSSIARYALSVTTTMVGVQRSHVRVSQRVADYERSLPRATAPKADPPIHRTAYDTLLRHAKRFRLKCFDDWSYPR